MMSYFSPSNPPTYLGQLCMHLMELFKKKKGKIPVHEKEQDVPMLMLTHVTL